MSNLARASSDREPVVRLRLVEEADLPLVARFYTDADVAGVFQWFGFRPVSARDVERQWTEDRLINDSAGRLVVDVAGEYAGEVDWRAVGKTGAYEIGICLLPNHRGRGIGTGAQRLLVEYLFSVSPVHRIQAGTEVGNVAEQRALERVGFRREGVLRSMYFRDGEFRDSIIYGLLRHEWEQSADRVSTD
jgi:RimJ/RimL family protein N-acetyltransferase